MMRYMMVYLKQLFLNGALNEDVDMMDSLQCYILL